MSYTNSSAGGGLPALLGDAFAQIFGQTFSIRVKKLSNTTLAASRHIKRENASLSLDERGSKTLLLKLPNL